MLNGRAHLCGSLLLSFLLASRIARAEEATASTSLGQGEVAPETTDGAPTNQAQSKDEPELDVLTFHRSNYWVTGFTRSTEAKFQFSFKYDLWPSKGHHTVYLAYTQKSLWDIYRKSAPFRESNYAPEVFYAHYHSDSHSQPNPGCNFFSEQVGVEHESNGEASDASRSWNRIFAELTATCYGQPTFGLLGLRVWYPIGIAENKTIVETQGYGELSAGLGIDDDALHMNGLLTVALRKGASKDLGKGSVTVDARWRPTYSGCSARLGSSRPTCGFNSSPATVKRSPPTTLRRPAPAWASASATAPSEPRSRG